MVNLIPNDIFQFSTYAALEAGFRDGQPCAGDLTSHGSDGIGAFEDGRLMMLSASQVWIINENATAKAPASDARLPFAMVTVFHPLETLRVQIPNIDHANDLLSMNGGVNTLMPVEIQATFSSMKILTGLDKTNTMTLRNVTGLIGGFVIPAWMESTSGPRIHCHFLSDGNGIGDGIRVGGRVVDFESDGEAVVSMSKCGRFHLGFPQGPGWEALNLS